MREADSMVVYRYRNNCPRPHPSCSLFIAYMLNTAERFIIFSGSFMDRCDRCLTSNVEGRLKPTILTTKREMVDVQTPLNIELVPAFILLWWCDWLNSLRYIKLQVNEKRLCSQGVLVLKWITLVTFVSQGDLWFPYNFHIDIIYLVVAIYKIGNRWTFESTKLVVFI